VGGVNRSLLLLLVASPLAAQGPAPIQDNSFLVEEAYNQESGVVQHISLFSREGKSHDWGYSFTQEWPFRGQRHQLSYTLPLLRSDGSVGLGDIFLNYRLQLVGHPGGKTWIAPRVSVILPTGSWRQGRGDGVAGLEVRLPGSFELAPWTTLHLNAGLTFHPSARAEPDMRADLIDILGGASLILFPMPTVNFLIESIVQNDAKVVAPGQSARSTSILLSPGIRWAHNSRSGLQVVPGVAYTIGLTHSSPPNALVLYLSFEHSFKRRPESGSGSAALSR
jgi:hypothetical protein